MSNRLASALRAEPFIGWFTSLVLTRPDFGHNLLLGGAYGRGPDPPDQGCRSSGQRRHAISHS